MKKLLFFIALSLPGLAMADTMIIRRDAGAPPDPGLIGNTLITDSVVRGANEFVYSSFTTTTPGQISYCHIRLSGNTGSSTIGVYDINGNILAYWNGATGSATGWYGGELNTPVTITAGTEYIVGIVTTDASWSSFKRNSMSGFYRRRKAMTYGATLSNFDPSSGYTEDSSSSALSIQCDDTSATP